MAEREITTAQDKTPNSINTEPATITKPFFTRKRSFRILASLAFIYIGVFMYKVIFEPSFADTDPNAPARFVLIFLYPTLVLGIGWIANLVAIISYRRIPTILSTFLYALFAIIFSSGLVMMIIPCLLMYIAYLRIPYRRYE